MPVVEAMAVRRHDLGTAPMKRRFTKMHGAGNDFVIVDCRAASLALDAQRIAQFGDRHRGIGFDQLLTIEPARDPSCAFAYGIYNADGSPSGQCGNGARCIAAWLRRDGALGVGAIRLQSPSGPVSAEVLADARIRIDMNVPRFAAAEVPLRLPQADPYRLPAGVGEVIFGAVSMGNPHAVVEVADVDAAPVTTLGPALATDSHFPQGCNVGFVQIVDRRHVRLRVWERGAGATLACGSGACAAVAVLHRRGRVDDAVGVDLPGGRLHIDWAGDGRPLYLSGPAEFVFEGEFDA